ncbi:MAG: lytic transglycosylase domain-containing protein [Burkholderiaceae bacterium]|nr:lytic transglycosylase domain-containing protein [Burkholderiaceae bacterium]
MHTARAIVCTSTLLLAAGAAGAEPGPPHEGPSCIRRAEQRYGIPQGLLTAISWIESRHRAGAVGPRLADGHQALGPMQISSIHAHHLAVGGIRLRDLFDPCVAYAVGAWALRHCLDRFGTTWKAVGCYNTGPAATSPIAQWRYAMKVQAAWHAPSARRQNPTRPTFLLE